MTYLECGELQTGEEEKVAANQPDCQATISMMFSTLRIKDDEHEETNLISVE